MCVPDCPGPPDPPANLSSMVVTNDVNPVTVKFTWSGLVGENAKGIPSNGNSSSLNYTLIIDGTSRSVTTTMEMVEMVNLTSCVSYNASLSASNKVHMGSPSTVEFSTAEKGMCVFQVHFSEYVSDMRDWSVLLGLCMGVVYMM